MLKQFLFLFSILIFVQGCAHQVEKEEVKEKNVRVQTHLVEDDLKSCTDCILGSVGDKVLKQSEKKVYYLYGAEHLNLSNYYFDIPVVFNKATEKWLKYFITRGREHFQRYAERAGTYGPVLSKILNDQGLPRDLIYLSMAESGFSNSARSWAKAVGPWQFMPYTGRKYGLEVDFFIDERRDPLKATVAASMYLRDLYDRFDSWELAMAGYNAGEGKISRAIRRYKTKNFWKIRRGRYLRAETKNYVPKIMALAIIGKNLSVFGFDNIEFKKALDFEEISVAGNTDLYKVADAIGVSFEEMKKYNPEVLRWQVAPHLSEYNLRVPVGKKVVWNSFENKDMVYASDYMPYQLKGYANLQHVGRKFKVPADVLSEINGYGKNKKLFPKTVVLLPFRKNHQPRKNHLYADLYEKPRKSILRRRAYRKWVNRGKRLGEHIKDPKKFYIVKKGDTLWDIARKTGVNINTIIRSNYRIVRKRMILPGDKLAIK